MAFNFKRTKYEITSSDEDSDADYISCEKNEAFQNSQRPGRKPKCFSKNAMVARENRLKKKMYITKLESDVTRLKIENKKLSTVVDNQSFLIAELKKEVRYLKSVITNSSDIGCLVRNIRQNTGMSVSTSLNNVSVEKSNSSHPWEDSKILSSPNLNLFDDMTTELPFHEDLLGSGITSLQEHDYTISRSNEDDVGVCLHVSKHKVSLEFCPSCSENSIQAWNS